LRKSSNCKCSKIPPASETSGRQAVNSFRRVRLRREGVEE
jgi:hypothetical protein